MSGEPPPHEATPEQAEQRILAEIKRLREATRAAGVIETDPLWPWVEAQCSVLGSQADLIGPLVRELRSIACASRTMVDRAVEEARERVVAIEAGSTERISAAVGERVDRHLAGRLWRMDWKASCTAVGAVALACLVGIMLGWRVGYSRAQQRLVALDSELSAVAVRGPDVAARWTDLIRYNPDLEDALRACRPLPAPTGGSPCAVPLWLAPAPAGTRASVAAAVGEKP